MRPIKFRGLTETGEWVYGYLSDYATISTNDYNNEGLRARYDVKPETVGQWTDKTDKHSKECYEGDIFFEYDNERKIYFILHYISERSAFALSWPEEFNDYVSGGWSAIESNFESEYVEVTQESMSRLIWCGSIHLNPELL